MGRIIDRYVLRELLPPFAMGVAVFTFFLVIDRIYHLIDLFITKGVPFLLVLGLLGSRWYSRALLGAATLVLLGGAALAEYHVGIEQGWWALPASCVAGGTAATVEDLKRMLQGAPPACDQVSFAFLGLTLAGWNFVVSLLLAAFTLAAALGHGRRAPHDRLAPLRR